MYCKSWEELRRRHPLQDGAWRRDLVEEYLIWSCHAGFSPQIHAFFHTYAADEDLADLLFSFLLDDGCGGSDCQMGAARILAELDRPLLRKKKELLLRAQENEVLWKRPFPHDEHLEWL